jgi:hypothetical protein
MYSLLVTGQFREPDLFYKTLKLWFEKDSLFSEVVVSTWADQKLLYEDFLRHIDFALPPVRYVLNHEPRFEFGAPANLIHQQHTLTNGLLACGSDFVFKIRTDFFVSPDIQPTLSRIFEKGETGLMKEFEFKLWVPWVDYEEPFFIADEAFFGARNDLLRLASRSLGILSEFGFPLANQHTVVFTPSLHVTGRVYRDWLRAQTDAQRILNTTSDAKFGYLNAMLASPWYQRMIGAYHRYLQDNFVVGCELGQAEFKPKGGLNGAWYADRRLEAAMEPALFARELAGFHNHFYAWSTDALGRLVKASCVDPALSHYAQAYADPARVLAVRDESALLEFVRHLAALA